MNLLDFEKPIVELESKLTDMKQLTDDSDESVNKAIQALENKIVDLKKRNFRKPYRLATCSAVASPRQALYARLHL